MALPLATGKLLRLSRLSRWGDNRSLIVPIDHSVSDGPVTSADGLGPLVRSVAVSGADAVVVHKGRVRALPLDVFTQVGLIVHLSAGTSRALDQNAKVLVGSAEDALRMGADAVSVHVNVGADTEAQQLADLGAVASACDSWNVPLLAMIYPRGPRINDPSTVDLLSHVVNIATDLGADLIKTLACAHQDDMARVVQSCPVPVLVAGGPSSNTEDEFCKATRVAMDAGCAGVAVGRRVFTSADPAKFVRLLSEIVHLKPVRESAEQDRVLTSGSVC